MSEDNSVEIPGVNHGTFILSRMLFPCVLDSWEHKRTPLHSEYTQGQKCRCRQFLPPFFTRHDGQLLRGRIAQTLAKGTVALNPSCLGSNSSYPRCVIWGKLLKLWFLGFPPANGNNHTELLRGYNYKSMYTKHLEQGTGSKQYLSIH